MGHGGQIFQSPSQSGGVTRPSQSYYTRGSVRGMARGGKALAQTFRSSGWQRGIGLVFFFVFFVSFLVCLWWFFVVVRFLTPPQAVAVPLCRRARPVQREFFFPTTTKCFLCEVFLNIVGL